MEKVIERLLEFLVESGFKIIGLILILTIGMKLIKFLMKIIEKGRGFNKLEKSVRTFISSFISIALKMLLFITAAAYIGIPMTSMLAVLGSAGLALGLALQGGLSNIAGGLMLLIFKPFVVGDYIDTHTDSGTVSEITIFYTVLLTPDNRKIVLPNGPLSNSVIVNYSSQTKRRLDLEFSVAYDSDIEKVKRIIQEVMKEHSLILKDEEMLVRVKTHAENGLIFVARSWVNKDDYWQVHFDLMENMKKSFDKNNIKIPFPQMDIHIEK